MTRVRFTKTHRTRAWCASLVFCLTCSTGCLYQGAGEAFEPNARVTDSRETVGDFPEVIQDNPNDCGAAALAAVLRYWGINAEIDHVRRATAGDDEGNIQAGALRDHAREQGLDAFLVNADVEDLRLEVRAKRPIMVGMVKPYVGDQWFAHYEVVTAFDREHIYTMDPASGWRAYPLDGFMREWEKSNRLALIIAPR